LQHELSVPERLLRQHYWSVHSRCKLHSTMFLHMSDRSVV
jgi:hypothetical protein